MYKMNDTSDTISSTSVKEVEDLKDKNKILKQKNDEMFSMNSILAQQICQM